MLSHDRNPGVFNTLRTRQDRRHFADDIFTCIFFNENCCILIKFSLKYVRKGPIDNNSALVQIMAWRRSGDNPLSEPMMISLPTHICVTRPHWVNDWTENLPCHIENFLCRFGFYFSSWQIRVDYSTILSEFLHGSHYNDIIMSAMAFQIIGDTIVCSTVCSGADQRTLQSSASPAFARGIHRWPVYTNGQ